MFNIEHSIINRSFATVQSSSLLQEMNNHFKRIEYVRVEGTPIYLIARQEFLLTSDDTPSMTVKQWLEAHRLLPSSQCKFSQILSESIDWRRPVWVLDKDESRTGIITPDHFIPLLIKEYQHLSAYFAALSETVNDAVTAVDHEGRVICWNSVAEETYNIPKQRIMNRKIGEHFRQESIMLLRILDEGRPVRQIYHQPTPETHVLINASPIIENNVIIGGIATEQDISTIVRLNEELYSNPSLQVEQDDPFSSIIGLGPTMKQSIHVAKKVTNIDTPVLIMGEPGSGKEKLAQAIHYGGKRKNEHFVSMNCSVIPPGLLEAELFGFQGGAFSGDENHGKAGKLEQAGGGTLFIEEIQDMPLDIQGKLLNTLRENVFYRLGGTDLIQVKARIITSTSHDLLSMMKQEQFLKDLYFQLSVFPIAIPPLRERTEDIPEWIQLFFKELSLQYEKPIPKLDPQVMTLLMNYDWPGNIKELRNTIERFILLFDTDTITLEHLPSNLQADFAESLPTPQDAEVMLKARVSEQREAAMIEEALRKTYGNKSAAAKLLGISRGTLYNKMKEYDLLKYEKS